MLTREENELLTRTGPGTPMGDLARRYWIPALLSWEIPKPDCPPVRVRLLGEELIAFRDTEGRIGLLEEHCPHRQTSLWFGRNEESGLRCVYHGWKFDVTGQCVHMMNEQESFADKVRITAYPAYEASGVVWTYMGPPESTPPLPHYEWTLVPEENRGVTKVRYECNWLQAFEGTMDTAHAPILHRTFARTDSPLWTGGAPRLELDVTDYGYRYFSVRKGDDDSSFVKGYQFIMPWTQIRAGADGADGHYCVPIDDETCMMWNWGYKVHTPLAEEEKNQNRFGNGPAHVDQDTFRSFRNEDNAYYIDREMQRKVNFTGIVGTNTQDRAVQESMGKILDRSKERLGPTDKAIIVARQLMLEAVRVMQEGDAPRGAATTSYYTVRGAQAMVPDGRELRDVMLPLMEDADGLSEKVPAAG